MDEFKILFDLFNFKLIVIVSEGVVLRWLMRVVEELVPVKLLVVLLTVLPQSYRPTFRNAQLQGDELHELVRIDLFPCQEIPDEGYLVYDDLDIAVADDLTLRQVAKTEIQPLVVAAVVYLLQKLDKLLDSALSSEHPYVAGVSDEGKNAIAEIFCLSDPHQPHRYLKAFQAHASILCEVPEPVRYLPDF